EGRAPAPPAGLRLLSGVGVRARIGALVAAAVVLSACAGGHAAGHPRTTGPTTTRATTPPATSPGRPRVARPSIVSMPIPFPASRRAEMKAYAERHYGLHTF